MIISAGSVFNVCPLYHRRKLVVQIEILICDASETVTYFTSQYCCRSLKKLKVIILKPLFLSYTKQLKIMFPVFKTKLRSLGIQKCNRISYLDKQILITDHCTQINKQVQIKQVSRIRLLWNYALYLSPEVIKLSAFFGGITKVRTCRLFQMAYICPRKCHLKFIHYSVDRSSSSLLIDFSFFLLYWYSNKIKFGQAKEVLHNISTTPCHHFQLKRE